MTTIPALYGVRLLVDNFDQCLAFYRDIMGFDIPPGHGYPYVSFSTGSSTVALFDRKMMAEAVSTPYTSVGDSAPDRSEMVFHVESVDLAYDELTKRGATFIAPPTDRPDWMIRTAHLRDPEGNLIELYEDMVTTGS